MIIFTIIISFIILGTYITIKNEKDNNKLSETNNSIINNITEYNKINSNIDLSKYSTNKYIMTQTELKFYRELKKATDILNMTIFCQVNMERLINVKDKNYSDRNRIKSRSIDFVIVNNNNCKVICCIELDDYTHNYNKVKETDNFKNQLFKQVEIPLHRINVANYYNIENLKNIIIGDL